MGLAEVQIWISMNVYKGIGKKNNGSEPKYKSDEERRTIGLTIESSDDIGMGGGRSGVVGEGTWEKLK